MKKKQQELLRIAIGWVLIGWSLLNMYFTLSDGSWQHIFWLSNHVGLTMGIAVLFRSSFWVAAELALAFVGELVWSLDYLGKQLFDVFIFGPTSYVFEAGYPVTLYFSTLQHLIIIPLGFWAFFLLATPEKEAWRGAVGHAAVLLIISLLFGRSLNVNCMWASCVGWIPTFPFYSLVWSVVYMGVFVYPVSRLLSKLVRR